MPVKREYKVTYVDWDYGENAMQIINARLNDLAADGWEVVTCIDFHDGLLYTLKRETPSGATKV